jgi:hypothetical protein
MLYASDKNTPDAKRDRINSYFFASSIPYEAMQLIRSMKKTFRNDEVFQKGLKALLKDTNVQKVEQKSLKPVRNGAVFHFLPERFAETLQKASCDNCPFIEAQGNATKSVYYPFADVITAEMLVGFASDSDEFYEALGLAMDKTRDLVLKFTKAAEILIVFHLKAWVSS